ncbi:phage tail spike protein [Jeotgalibaca sp. A127]|uniref:phage tail spike protein n=1 Tax=Jeotgalibaca sp. A127 TaxID=3457324 RepID=UPI003FD3E2D5
MEIEPIYLFDKNKELIDIVPFENLTANSQDWALNGLIKGTVTGIYTESIEQAQFYGTRDIDDPNVFWQYKIVNYTKENGQFTFEGIYVLFDDLAGRGVIRDRRPRNATIPTVMEYILEDTGWQLGQVHSTHRGTSNYYYVSKLEAFWDFIEKWRVEFKPRMTFSNGKVTGKYIDIYDRLSDDYGKWYEYGDSLLTVVAEEMRESVFTAFIGRGKGEEVGDGFGRKIDFSAVNWSVASGNPVDKPIGQDYVEIPWATDLYGYEDGTPRMTVIDFPDIEDESELLDSTYEYALTECRPKVQFKSNVLESGRADVGEIVTILRPDMGIRYKTRVFNLKRNFLNVSIKTIQFGEQLVQSAAQRTKKTATAIKKQEEQTVYWLEMLRQAIVDSYFNEDGYNYDLDANNEYGLPGGYYSFDRPIDQNPSKVVYMGAGKILIANSKNPDGTWDWRTAMTGDGITLDAVNTGVLTAGRILSPIDGSYWDLENGVMDLKSGVLTGTRLRMDLDTGNIVSDAINGSQTLLQNGVLLVRAPGGDSPGQSVGYIGFSQDGANNNFTLTTANGRSLQLRYSNGDDTFSPLIEYLSYLDRLYFGKKATFQDDVAINGNLNMNQKQITEVQKLRTGILETGNIGSILNDTDNRIAVKGTSGAKLGVGDQTGGGFTPILMVDSTRAYIYKTLSMEGNDITNQSDERLKENIVDAEYDGLSLFRSIQPKNFTWKNTDRFGSQTELGFIAQDLSALDPELVTQTPDEDVPDDVAWAINETQMNRRAWIATHQLVKENDTLKQELADLKTLLNEKGLI